MDQEASGVTVHRQERALRRSQNRIRRAGDPERGKGLGDSMRADPTSGCFSDDVLCHSQGTDQGETRRHAKLVDTNSKRIVAKKVGTSVNPADFMTKPRPKIEPLVNTMGYEFVEQCLKRAEAHGLRLVGSLTNAKKKPTSWAPPQQNETLGNS